MARRKIQVIIFCSFDFILVLTGFAWNITRPPEGLATDSIVAWHTGPTSAGAGTLRPKVDPPSTDRDKPRPRANQHVPPPPPSSPIAGGSHRHRSRDGDHVANGQARLHRASNARPPAEPREVRWADTRRGRRALFPRVPDAHHHVREHAGQQVLH